MEAVRMVMTSLKIAPDDVEAEGQITSRQTAGGDILRLACGISGRTMIPFGM